jgi:nucleotide-binding universal stress UspA family protein
MTAMPAPLDLIVCATDFSPSARPALFGAMRWAERFDATLHVVSVKVMEEDPFGEQEEVPTPSLGTRLRERFKELVTRETETHTPYDPASLRVKHALLHGEAAAPALVRYADEHSAGLVVVGTHGRRGVRQAMLGSVARELLHTAPCPVLVVPSTGDEVDDETRGVPEHVLVAVDDPAEAASLLRTADALAARFGAPLSVLHVLEARASDATADDLEAALRTQYRAATDGGSAPSVAFAVETGRARHDLVPLAEQRGADLVVMSTHSRTGVKRLILGSVAEATVCHAHAPVLVIRLAAARAEGTAPPQEDEPVG